MGALSMSRRERSRLEQLSRVRDGVQSLKAAAEALGLSYRQAKRLWRRYRRDGDAGVRHGLRGKPPNRRASPERERVLELVRKQYADFGPTLAAEKLAERDGVAVDHETLRRWLLAEGLWERRRKRKPYRQRRERRPRFGELVQMDGSPHDWFEGRGPRCVLMVMIDDATNRTYARFFPEETTEAAFLSFQGWARRHGLPEALYVDKDSIYREPREPTTAEALAGEAPLTQFGRAMKTLGVAVICANSPQAKGRVERRHGVFQDRLVKELRLEGIADLDGANAYLAKTFLPQMNQTWIETAADPSDAHRPAPPARELTEILCWEEERTVQNDWTVQWRRRVFQVAAAERTLNLAGKTIIVRELLDGTVRLVHRGQALRWKELAQRPRPETTPRKGNQLGQPANLPAKDHPWRGDELKRQVALRRIARTARATANAPAAPRQAARRRAKVIDSY
jgi:transposase